MSRFAVFIYGFASYAVTLGVFAYAFGFIGGFLAPTMLDGPAVRPLAEALAIDFGLLLLFAVQHSVMARPAFKQWWTRFVPEAAERSTYLVASSLAMLAIFVCWEPIGGVLWQAEGAARAAIIGLYAFGWAVLLYATFLINHFDLFGLAQVWRHLRHDEYQPPRFRTPSLYRVVRHPLYIGWLTIFWAAPAMTVAHFVFALTTTAYILIAIRLEERDLEAAFGDEYAAYRRRTPMLIPRLRGSPAAVASEAQGRG